MAVTAVLKTAGNSAAGASSYTTGTFTPSVANDSLLIVATCHRVAGQQNPGQQPVLSGGSSGGSWPIAFAVPDGAYDVGGTAAAGLHLILELWGCKALVPTAGQSFLLPFAAARTAIAWAIIEVAGIIPIPVLLGVGAIGAPQQRGQDSIRRIGIKQASGLTAEQSGQIEMGKLRGAMNGMLSFWAHNKNEGKAPNAAYTELTDQQNGGLVSLEVQFVAPGTVTPSASWVTATPAWAGIALEIAAPSNTMFTVNPDEALYA